MATALLILFVLSCCQCDLSSSRDNECEIYWLEIWGDRVWKLYKEEICNCNFNWDTVAVAVELASVVVQTEVVSVQPHLDETNHNQNEDILPAYGDVPPSYPSIEGEESRFVNLSNHGFTNSETDEL